MAIEPWLYLGDYLARANDPWRAIERQAVAV